MKKIFLMISLVTGLGLFAKAQDKEPKTPALRAAKQTKVLTQKLNLTNTQLTKVNALLLEQGNSIDSLKALKGTNDKKEQRYAHKLIHDKSNAKLQAVLTPEQKSKYAAFVEAKKEKKAAKKKADAAPAAKS